MDADGLPLVGPGVDYNKVGPIHQKRTLAFVNHFLIETTSFLNNFASVCDEKLEDLLLRIQRLESSMCVLEAKLASIPGLEDTNLATLQQASPSITSTTQPTTSPNQSQLPNSEPVGPPLPPPPPNLEATPPPVENDIPKNVVSQDPRYAKYFKMIHLGVPAGAVKLKMSAEGVDPDLLDTPDAAAPSMPPSARKRTGSDEEDSNDDGSDFSD